MLPIRKALLALTVLATLGGLGAVLAWGLYVRSDAYRRRVQRESSAFMDMDVRIGQVVPLDLDRRAFDDVSAALSGNGTTIFECRRAVWYDNGDRRLDLAGFALRLGVWPAQRYRQVLRGGLAHDFHDLGLREVRTSDGTIRWEHPRWPLRLEGVHGIIRFEQPPRGQADLVASGLNGHAVPDGVRVAARFLTSAPGGNRPGPFIEQATLTVPSIPLGYLETEGLLGSALHSGRFEGTITFREDLAGVPRQRFGAAGSVDGLDLAEVTGGLPTGPVGGRLSVTLDRLEIDDRRHVGTAFAGSLSELDLHGVGRLLGIRGLDGKADLTIHAQLEVRGQPRQIDVGRLSARGRCDRLPLSILPALGAPGAITGHLTGELRRLEIVDGQIIAAELELRAVPPIGAPGTIDREVLVEAMRNALGFSPLPSVVLPERIEYIALGLRLAVDQNELRIHGTHGLDRKVILTVRLGGKEIPLVRAPDRPYDLAGWLTEFNRRANAVDRDRLHDWWRRRPSTATVPTTHAATADP